MHAFNYSSTSGLKTGTTQILTSPGALCGVDVMPPDSGYSILSIWDSENSTTSGKLLLAEIHVDAGWMGVNHEYSIPVVINRGIYAEFTGTGVNANFVVRYIPG